MNANQFVYKSFVKDTIRDLEREDARLRMKAANYVKDRVIEKISRQQGHQITRFIYRGSAPGQPPAEFTGNLIKGIKTKSEQYSAIVGAVAPAYHALLLELGTRKRVPGMAPRPFLYPTLEEETPVIKEILSEVRV